MTNMTMDAARLMDMLPGEDMSFTYEFVITILLNKVYMQRDRLVHFKPQNTLKVHV